jgi:hypothetical protein
MTTLGKDARCSAKYRAEDRAERLEACRESAYDIVAKNELLCSDWPAEDYENLLTLLSRPRNTRSDKP